MANAVCSPAFRGSPELTDCASRMKSPRYICADFTTETHTWQPVAPRCMAAFERAGPRALAGVPQRDYRGRVARSKDIIPITGVQVPLARTNGRAPGAT